jgi:hypothetical protein
MLGVSIDEVWNQKSLVDQPRYTKSRSKYTVPIEPIESQPDVNYIPVTIPQQTMPEHPPVREYLTQNTPPPPPPPPSTNDQLLEYQKEIHYLRTLVNQLKKDLYDSRYRYYKEYQQEKRKKWMDRIVMVVVAVVLIIVVLLLVQILQKMNKLTNQPVLI